MVSRDLEESFSWLVSVRDLESIDSRSVEQLRPEEVTSSEKRHSRSIEVELVEVGFDIRYCPFSTNRASSSSSVAEAETAEVGRDFR